MDEHATHASSIKPWRRGGAASVHASTPLVIDVFVDARMRDVDVADDAAAAEAVSRTLVERWVLSHDARCRGDGEEEEVVEEEEEEECTSSSSDVAVTYKRAVIMVRSLLALTRALPANRLHRARVRGGARDDASYRLSCEVRDVGTLGTNPGTDEGRHPGADAWRTYEFAPVDAAAAR